MFKKSTAIILVAMLALSLVACTPAPTSSSSSSSSSTSSSTSSVSPGERSKKTNEYAQADTVVTEFFKLNVNSVKFADKIGDVKPVDSTTKYLVVNITVLNTFDDSPSIPMSDADFELTWPALSGSTIYPTGVFADTQLPAEYEIFKGKDRSGDLVFIIPNDATDFKMSYYDMWEDGTVGDTYAISLKAE